MHKYFVFTLTEYGIIPFIFLCLLIVLQATNARVSLQLAKLNRNNVCLISFFNYVFFSYFIVIGPLKDSLHNSMFWTLIGFFLVAFPHNNLKTNNA